MLHYHWHLEMIPRLTHVAGFEWGTGFYINPTPPEEARSSYATPRSELNTQKDVIRTVEPD